MIDATKFAKPGPPHPYDPDSPAPFRRFRFGGETRENLAKELHRFADAVADGLILLQSVQTGQRADADDYARQALYIEFVEAEAVLADELAERPSRKVMSA